MAKKSVGGKPLAADKSPETVKEKERANTFTNLLPKDGRLFGRGDVRYWMGQEAIAFQMWLTDNPQPNQPAPIAYQMFLNATYKKEVSNG
jgi:hypothetical protein